MDANLGDTIQPLHQPFHNPVKEASESHTANEDTGSGGEKTAGGHRAGTRGRAASLTPEPNTLPSTPRCHLCERCDVGVGGWALRGGSGLAVRLYCLILGHHFPSPGLSARLQHGAQQRAERYLHTPTADSCLEYRKIHQEPLKEKTDNPRGR